MRSKSFVYNGAEDLIVEKVWRHKDEEGYYFLRAYVHRRIKPGSTITVIDESYEKIICRGKGFYFAIPQEELSAINDGPFSKKWDWSKYGF